MGRDPKPTAFSRKVEAALAAPGDGLLSGDGRPVPTAPTEVVSNEVARALIPFLGRSDGWLRLVPEHDGAAVYFKWKWTAGPHANCYVMTVYPYHEAAQALLSLAVKVDAVDSGKKAPVKDHYFQR